MSQSRLSSRYSPLRHDAEAAASRFPALLAEAERIAASVAHGAHGRRRPGAGETFWEYRPHRSEDGAGSVDWRRSARGDQLFVRETEWEAANAVHLWRDGSAGMATGSNGLATKKDRAAICLMAVASLLIRGGERIAALGETGRARGGNVGLELTGRALADGPGSAAWVEAPDLPRHARVVLASDFLAPTETWEHRLAAFNGLQARGILLRVIDPAEEDFPFEGRTRFTPPGSGEPLLFGNAEEARRAYGDVWSSHTRQLKDLARRMGWTLITHRTDRPASTAVMALYQALAGGRA